MPENKGEGYLGRQAFDIPNLNASDLTGSFGIARHSAACCQPGLGSDTCELRDCHSGIAVKMMSSKHEGHASYSGTTKLNLELHAVVGELGRDVDGSDVFMEIFKTLRAFAMGGGGMWR